MGQHANPRPTTLLLAVSAALAAALTAGCSSGTTTGGSGAQRTPSAQKAPVAKSRPKVDAKADPLVRHTMKDVAPQNPRALKSSGAAAQPHWCGTDDLSTRLGEPSGAAGNRYAVLVFTNTTATACRTTGYVGLQLLRSGNAKVPTQVVRTHIGAPQQVLTLRPNTSARTTLHWGTVPGDGDSTAGNCQPTANRIQVTPPDSFTQLETAWNFGPVCQQGRIEVEKLQPGSGTSISRGR